MIGITCDVNTDLRQNFETLNTDFRWNSRATYSIHLIKLILSFLKEEEAIRALIQTVRLILYRREFVYTRYSDSPLKTLIILTWKSNQKSSQKLFV